MDVASDCFLEDVWLLSPEGFQRLTATQAREVRSVLHQYEFVLATARAQVKLQWCRTRLPLFPNVEKFVKTCMLRNSSLEVCQAYKIVMSQRYPLFMRMTQPQPLNWPGKLFEGWTRDDELRYLNNPKRRIVWWPGKKPGDA